MKSPTFLLFLQTFQFWNAKYKWKQLLLEFSAMKDSKLQRTWGLEDKFATEIFFTPETIRISVCTHLKWECFHQETSYLLFILKGENSGGAVAWWMYETLSALCNKPQTIHEIA